MTGHAWHPLSIENAVQPRVGARVTGMRVAPLLDTDPSTCAGDRAAAANGRPPCGPPVLIFETTRVETSHRDPREKIADEALCRTHSARMMLRATGRITRWEDNLPTTARLAAERAVLDWYSGDVNSETEAHLTSLVDTGLSYLPAFLVTEAATR